MYDNRRSQNVLILRVYLSDCAYFKGILDIF